MDDLKEQIRQLTKIIADLSSLKNSHQSEVRNNLLHNKDILSDSLSDVLPFNAELSNNQPVPETPPEPQSIILPTLMPMFATYRIKVAQIILFVKIVNQYFERR